MMKLTIPQLATLERAAISRSRMISYSTAVAQGASGRTLDSLVRRGFLARRSHANGNFWELTDAGRAALQSTQEKTDGK